jgi:hypothetical protein
MTKHLWAGALAFGLALGCGGGSGGAGPKSASDQRSSPSEVGGGASEVGKKRVAPAKGTQQLEQRSASLEFELTLEKGEAAGGMQSGSWSLEEERSLEVLDGDDSAVTKLRVVYGRREAKPLLGVELTAATAGHTYAIGPGGHTIEREDGKALTGDERDALMSEYDWVGGAPPLMKWLEGGAAKEGATLEGGSAEARALVGVLSGVDYSNAKVSVTPKKKHGDSLPLDVTAALRLTSRDTHFDLDLKGTATVDLKTGWVTQLELAGPVKPSGHVKLKKDVLEVHGRGTAKISRSRKK